MFLGYQNNKIKFYVEQPFEEPTIEMWEETDIEYALKEDEYVIKDEAYEQWKQEQERQELNLLSLTKREVFLAIYRDKGITPEQIKAMITNPEALIEFDYSEKFYRGNPLIDSIGSALGYTTEQLDYLFKNAQFE